MFPNCAGAVLNEKNRLRRHFRPALERAEIPEKRVAELRIYDLRHGFATAAAEADVRTTADLMGHASARMVLDVYQHVSDARKREAASRILQQLFN